jgi:hypothetical protein
MSSSVWQYFRKTNKGMIESIFRVKKLNGDIQWYIIDRQGIRYKIEDVTDDGDLYTEKNGWVPKFNHPDDIDAIREAAVRIDIGDLTKLRKSSTIYKSSHAGEL